MRHRFLRRLVALVLSWVVPATTLWGSAPPAPAAPVARAPVVSAPGPVLHPGASVAAAVAVPAHLGASLLPLLHDDDDDDDDDDAVKPILECVAQDGPDAYTAHFGYKNENRRAVTIPIGEGNRFAPGAPDRGQPTRFRRGRTPYYPNPAFNVPFAGGNLVWTLRGPDGRTRTSTASPHSRRCATPPPPPPACALTVFGSQRFDRTCGPPDVYTRAFTLPAGAASPYTLTIRNGEASGSHRVSSGSVQVNGVEVAGPSDFNHNVGQIQRTVSLQASNTLRVQLHSAPDSYLTISICASSGDPTPPTLSFGAPPALTSDATPGVVVRYSDTGSGVDTASLQVFLDEEDRSSLFSRRSDEASAEIAPPLGDGVHRLRALLRDLAGNAAEAATEFSLDTVSPAIAIAEPAAGAFLATATPTVRVTYADASGIDPGTLSVAVNGVDRTAAFARTETEAVATLDLPAGPSQIVARVRDLAGNESSAAASVVVDLQPPALAIAQPASGARLGTAEPEVLVQYADDQGLDLATLIATLDGVAVTLIAGPDTATGVLGPLADGPHTLGVRLRDRAGHEATATTAFGVDTALPDLQILYPTAGLITHQAAPLLHATYADAQGLDLGSLRIRVNGADRSASFVPGPDSVTGDLTGLVEGENGIAVEIRDQTGNLAQASVAFTRDTVAPTVAVTEPAAGTAVANAQPRIAVGFGDGGTGIEPAFTRIFVDGADRTDAFALGATSATGTLDTPLPDGAHEVRGVVQDRAGNVAEAVAAFVVDTLAPDLGFGQPFPGAFVNDATPDLRIAYSDAGAGLDLATLRVYLRSGDGPEGDVTALLAAADAEATGALVEALGEGTHTLRAEIRDRAGNLTTAEAAFELDTVAPTVLIEAPGLGDYVATPTPSFTIRYADDRSGVELGLLSVLVDGLERTDRLVVGPESAAGTLLPEDALPDGPHTVEATVVDRAGNTSLPAPHPFFVDTVPPVVGIVSPAAGAYLGEASVAVQASFGDASAAGVFTARVFVDGVERTSELSITAADAQGVLTLADGTHGLRVEAQDWAGNLAQANADFTLDLLPPVLAISSPGAGAVVGQSPVEVTGTATDADPQLTVTATAGSETVACSPTFACSLPLAEGTNAVTVTAADRFGRTASATRTLTLDTQPPVVTIVQPAAGEYANGDTLVVQGAVSDATATTVTVNGVAASVQEASFSATIPVGAGPQLEVVAVATDLAGNIGRATVAVGVDRAPPAVAITSPLNGAYLQGPGIDVAGTVNDASPVMLDVNGQPADVAVGAFTARLPVVDGPLSIVATARDAANNAAQATASVSIDSVAPVIVITQPADGTVTRETALAIEGSVSDSSPVTATLDGAPLALAGGAFGETLALGAEGSQSFTVSATDAAGNIGGRTLTLLVDRTPPVVNVGGPAEGAVLAGLPVVVSGTASDASAVSVAVNGEPATQSGSAWQASLTDLADGPQGLTIVATDAAGNTVSVARTIVLDSAPPVLTVTSPAPGTLTRFDQIPVTGTVMDASATTLTLNGAPCATSGGSFACTAPLLEGDNHLLVVATDAAGRQAAVEVDVTRDATPPVLDLVAPPSLSRGRTGQASATAQDAVGVAEIVLRLNGQPLATCPGASCSAALSVPDGAVAGDTLTLTAEARDTAGNVATASRGISVVADGVVVGTVLDDATSLPLAGATTTLLSAQGVATATTDERGRYSLPAGDTTAILIVTKPGMATVERTVSIASGVGTVPVDARLTALVVPTPEGTQLTPLSPQGLPGLLPLGWSPLAAFDLRGAGPFDAPATGLPAGPVHLAAYNATLHAWTLVASDLLPTDGALATTLPGPGAYALVVPDPDGPALPAPGAVLPDIPMVELPVTATSTGQVDPAFIPPTGGTARGTLRVASSIALPSGTVVQAEIEETYSLASGQTASEETRRHDILLFRAQSGTTGPVPPCPDCLSASIPITPRRTYDTAELTSGVVHLDILAGREAIRGKTGGSAPVVVEDGPARLSVPGMAMPEDTAVSVKVEDLSAFLPATGVTALAEVLVDLSGKTLGLPAELSVQTSIVSPGDVLVVARVERVQGIPYLAVVALAQLVGDRAVSQAYPGLPGVVAEGRYVFFRVAGPVGFVAGTASASGAPVRALVATDGLPFVGSADAQGRFQVAAVPGSVTLQATVPATSLEGTASALVEAGQTASQDVVLTGTVTTATVRPADGSPAVSTNTPIEIEASAPLNPATATAANVRLLTAADGQAVAMRLVLSGSRKVLALVPDQALLPSTSYRIEASGLADTFGGLVSVPTTTFNTKADVAPVYDVAKLVFSLPDADGNVSLTAPTGTLAPGTEILVINATSGFVATFTAENDGAVGVVLPASFPATINDKLFVTITDPLGNVQSFTRSQFEDPATGRTAVGPGGGTVKAADDSGAELRIPEGALESGATLKMTSFTLEDLPEDQRQTPDFPEANFAAGLRIESGDKPSFKKELDLAFPLPQGLPANPQDASFYVFRRLEGPNGSVAFETIDHAFIEGEGASAKVVTASWPYGGYASSFGAFTGSFGAVGVETNYVQLMWTYNSLLPGRAVSGVITGQVLRAKWSPGSEAPGVEPVLDAIVSEGEIDANGKCHPRIGSANNLTAAVSQRDGTYTLIDPHYAGGTVTIAAIANGEARCATAYEVQRASTNLDPRVQALLAGSRYDQIATANISFPALAPAEPPAAINIDVLRMENGQRQAAGGIVTQGTPLVLLLTASSAGNLMATLQGQPCAAKVEGPGQAIVDLETDPKCRITDPGTYTVVAQGVATFGGVVTASRSFLVVAPGQGNDEPLADSAPAVIAVAPKQSTRGVPVNSFPQVTFSEPVRIHGAASLKEGDDAVAARLLGVMPNGAVLDLAQDAGAPITSLTMVPSTELKYGTTYAIELGQGIEDLDQPPKALQPLTSTFETFTPSGIASTQETFGSPGMVLLGNRAYLVQANFYSGYLKVFDVTDPTAPVPVAQDPQGHVLNRPVDVAGEGTTIVVATGSTGRPKPSNVYVFDVSDPTATRWVGAASVTSSATSGHVTRLQMRGGLLYSATYKQGIQVVDLDSVRSIFAAPGLGPYYPPAYWDMVSALSTDGKGFGVDAAVRLSIPVKNALGRDAYLKDIEVDDLPLDGFAQPLVLATGDVPFVVVNPQGAIAYDAVEISSPEGRLASGEALASGRLGNRQVAVVAGIGVTPRGSVPMLAVIDLADPRNPTTLGMLELPPQATAGFSITDVVLKGSVALIGLQEADLTQALGRVLTVNLGDGTRPVYAGAVNGIGGRLAVGEGNVLFGTARSVFGTGGPLGGLHVATLGSIVLLQDQNGRTLPRIKLPRHFTTRVSAILASAEDAIEAEVSIVEKDGSTQRQARPNGNATRKTILLQRDRETGRHSAPLTIVDKDCAIELTHDPDTDEQIVAPNGECHADLESGPWTKLKIKLPAAYGSLERVVDIHAFRLVAIGDSLTQGVQHAIVVHQHQRYSFPAQMANQINKYLKQQYGQQAVFKQPMIADPGIGDPPLGRPYGPGSGTMDELDFPVPGRLNRGVQPVNNLATSGARVYHLYNSKEGHWPPYCPENLVLGTKDAPPFCDTRPDNFADLKNKQSPIWNYKEPKSVWYYSLGGLDKTPVEQAADLDPSLLVVQIGNNDVLGAALDANTNQLTPPDLFRTQYDELLAKVAELTQRRADVIVATVPDVDKIANLRNLGEQVGAVPFTANVPVFEDKKITRGMENSFLDDRDETGACHGVTLPDGKCEKGSARVPLAKIFETDGFIDQVRTGVGLRFGRPKFRLTAEQVLDAKEIKKIQSAATSLNDHVLARAQKRGFAVLDVRKLFQERLQATSDPTKLNGLFVGTACATAPSESEVVRGYGNTLFSWDGVHANSAGYALAANFGLDAVKTELRSRSFGGLEPFDNDVEADSFKQIPSGSRNEEDSITWLLFEQYLGLERSRLGCAEGPITSVE